MTVCHASVIELFDAAKHLGCTGIELRNDLKSPLFGGLSSEQLIDEAKARKLRVLALAEVYGFNGKNVGRIQDDVRRLAAQALACGSESIVLIPEIADRPVSRDDQMKRLQTALAELTPTIEKAGVVALIEPLGFLHSSVRYKEDVVRVLDNMGRPACYGLVHDTFHHYLSGENDVFADLTRIVHISGVDDFECADSDLTDAHRGLVGPSDRLKNIYQINRLRSDGYTGPFSFEAFSPDVQNLQNPVHALSASLEFIASELAMGKILETE